MNLNISGHHVEVTPALREYITSKLERITRHFDQVVDVNATLSVEKLQQKADVTLRVRGKDIHVEATDKDMYAAIDLLVDKLDRQVVKHKECLMDHRGDSIKHQQTVEEE